MAKNQSLSPCLQSFGGGRLIGENLVRVTYIDEAGISNPKEEPFLTVGAVIVEADKRLRALKERLAGIADEYVPPEARIDFIFHATELFHGGKNIKRDDPRWPMALRMEIARELAGLPLALELPVVFGWVDRNDSEDSFPEEGGQYRQMHQHALAYMRCILNVDRWMRLNTENEITMMIVEDNDVAKKLIRDVQVDFQDKNISGLTDEERKYFPLRTIEEDPSFQPKRPSSVLQLSDFCAYIFKRFLMNPSDERYLPFWEKIKPCAIYFGMGNGAGHR